MSLFRIGANIQAMDSLRSLYGLNKEIGIRQARLASGKRINTAQDDTAGYSIARSLEARRNGLSTALSNVQNAKMFWQLQRVDIKTRWTFYRPSRIKLYRPQMEH